MPSNKRTGTGQGSGQPSSAYGRAMQAQRVGSSCKGPAAIRLPSAAEETLLNRAGQSAQQNRWRQMNNYRSYGSK